MTYKYWEIEIDGPDKTGKDLLCKYLCEMSNYRFSINVRGLISQLVYAKKFNRNFNYDTSCFSKKKVLILLTAEPDDLAVRCKMTNEPVYDFKKDLEMFIDIATDIEDDYCIFAYNTSYMTPYKIAKDILDRIARLEVLNHG